MRGASVEAAFLSEEVCLLAKVWRLAQVASNIVNTSVSVSSQHLPCSVLRVGSAACANIDIRNRLAS